MAQETRLWKHFKSKYKKLVNAPSLPLFRPLTCPKFGEMHFLWQNFEVNGFSRPMAEMTHLEECFKEKYEKLGNFPV
jgi:hypothetical protein